MSFQGYIDAIERETGKTPDDWRAWAAARDYLTNGTLRADVKAGAVIAALKDEFGLGRGHAMSLVALLKGSKHADGLK